ncbi:MAG: hypothetical protein Ta2G_19110 [Termitinemataceae bacterium]|nr:MAG: hypothetical protein Ta2G_19110 [Termitinemataceae bacterium]
MGTTSEKYNLICVDKHKCNNCHACISVCPVKDCIDGSGDTADIINERCIACGSCIPACHQSARYYNDDTKSFFDDLKNKKNIVAIMAPSAAAVFSSHEKLITYLKSIGVRAVFDASFGAELYVRSCIEYTKENKQKTLISSACPAIVSYAKIYNPSILKYFAPTQSPIIHAAIMIRNFFKEYDDCKIAAITPCSAKKMEFRIEGHVDYNVSMKHLAKHIGETNVDISSFESSDYDGPKAERGVSFSTPGAMLEVLKREIPGIHNVRSISGQNVYSYFKKISYLEEDVPFVVDCLHCEDGCNSGVGILDKLIPSLKLELKLENRKKDAIAYNDTNKNLESDLAKYWDKDLYKRTFAERSNVVSDLKEPSDDELVNIYHKMKKFTASDFLNCTSCGYGTCRAMAISIFNKLNKPENCHHYLAATNLEKEKLLQEETEKSNKLAIAAKEASKAKSDFLATMSHEIRTPLNAIIGFSEIALQKEMESDLTKDINTIVNSGRVLLSIVNDILDISKIESGKIEFIQTKYDTAQLVNDTVMINIVRIKSKQIDFRIDIDNNVPKYLFGDELRVKQILNNLLSNAFKYTKEGNITLSIKYADESLTMSVKDTGIGIKKENIGKLFGEYAQLDSKANRKIEGTGLGLAITKMLIEKMNGSISVETEYGVGSCFTARIKQKSVGGSVIESETINRLSTFTFNGSENQTNIFRASTKFPDAHILIVDDVRTNLEVAKGLLLPYQLKVDCVQSGEEAINLIKEKEVKYDIIFLDHMMPRMDGMEACCLIRHLDSDYARNIPIIAFTAEAFVGSKEKFTNAGFNDYLSKPIEIMQLDSMLNKYLGHKAKYSATDVNAEIYNKQYYSRKIDGINYNEGLRRFGDEKVYFEIMKSFAETTPAILEDMKTVTSETIEGYAINVHGIKSTARAIGAMELGRMAEELEHMAKERRVEFTKINNVSFLQEAEILISEINNFLQLQNENKIAKEKKTKPDKKVLDMLRIACTNYDVENVDKLIEQLDMYEYKSDSDLIRQIKGKLNLSMFEDVVILLDAYTKNGSIGGDI